MIVDDINLNSDMWTFWASIKQTKADITRIGLYGTKHFKLPKLSELYFFLFNKNADGLHDAIVDTTVMLECFYEMLRRNYIKLV